MAAIGRIPNAHHQAIAFRLQGLGDIEGERRVTARVRTDFDVVDPHVSHPVDGAEMQQDTSVFPVARHCKGLLIPQGTVGSDLFLHTRQRRLDAERHEDVAFILLWSLLPLRHDGILPQAVEVFPFGAHHHRTRVFGQSVFRRHLFGPLRLDFITSGSVLGHGQIC